MREIPLTQGRVALVDEEDYLILMRFKWQYGAGGYAVHSTHAGGKSVKIAMHRFLLSPARGQFVDHLNHNPLDNRRENLRVVNQSQNTQNTRFAKSVSGFKGVRSEHGHYLAVLELNGERKRLGTFQDPLEAAAAYDRAVRKFYGPQGQTNERMFLEFLEKLQSLK